MTDTLDDIVTEPVSGMTHSVRRAQTPASKAPCQLLLHGVGSNESGFVALARQFAGFSQGGMMRASVGLTAPASVAGFGVLSARILPEILPLVAPGPALGSQHAFVRHGVQDETLGTDFAHHAREVPTTPGLPFDYHEYADAGHALYASMVMDFQRRLGKQLVRSQACASFARAGVDVAPALSGRSRRRGTFAKPGPGAPGQTFSSHMTMILKENWTGML